MAGALEYCYAKGWLDNTSIQIEHNNNLVIKNLHDDDILKVLNYIKYFGWKSVSTEHF